MKRLNTSFPSIIASGSLITRLASHSIKRTIYSVIPFRVVQPFLPQHLLAPFCLPLSGGICGGINSGGIKSATINTTKTYRIRWYRIGLIKTEYK
jgi:hypothetical protein